jgi:hypothetical protein
MQLLEQQLHKQTSRVVQAAPTLAVVVAVVHTITQTTLVVLAVLVL